MRPIGSSPIRLRLAVAGVLASAALAAGPVAGQSMEEDAMAMSQGTLRGAEGHEAAGAFEIHGAGAERHVRFGSDFKVERGPDVYVVLSRGANVSDGDLYLGKLKRFSGAADYAIPANADLSSYTHLVLWCKKYSVAMGAAPLPRSAKAGDAMAKDGMAKDGMAQDGMKKEEKTKEGDKMKQDDAMMQPDSAHKP